MTRTLIALALVTLLIIATGSTFAAKIGEYDPWKAYEALLTETDLSTIKINLHKINPQDTENKQHMTINYTWKGQKYCFMPQRDLDFPAFPRGFSYIGITDEMSKLNLNGPYGITKSFYKLWNKMMKIIEVQNKNKKATLAPRYWFETDTTKWNELKNIQKDEDELTLSCLKGLISGELKMKPNGSFSGRIPGGILGNKALDNKLRRMIKKGGVISSEDIEEFDWRYTREMQQQAQKAKNKKE